MSKPSSIFFARPFIALRRLYKLFAKPLQTAQDVRNREIVLLVLLGATFFVLVLLFILLLISYFYLGNVQVGDRLFVCVVLGAFLVGVYWILRRKKYWLAASLLTGFYGLLAFVLVWQRGVGLAFSILLLCFMIVLAGILLGSRFALVGTAFAILVLVFVQAAHELGWHVPDESWLRQPSSFGDVFGYSAVLASLGLISWLFERQNEFALRRAAQAEADLLAEQAQLEIKIEERTLELEVAQFEEMQQLYRFAELGHLSAAMLHELANHLTVLTFNIDDLEQARHSQALRRARHSIRYLEHMVERVSMQLHGGDTAKLFNVPAKVDEVLELLRPRALDQQVQLSYVAPEARRKLKLYGDPVKFNQIIAVIITNAIEAYEAPTTGEPAPPQTVTIETNPSDHGVAIVITDNGKGISKAEQRKLFEPFFSTKEKGMGIGLFIAKNMVEKYFHGSVAVTSRRGHTTFKITLPYESQQPKQQS